MVKNKECEIIYDLLPNYIENIVCDDSRKFIEYHLSHCSNCKKEYENMNMKIALPIADERKINYLKGIQKRIFIFLLISIVLCVIAFIASIFYNEPNIEEALFTLGIWGVTAILIFIRYVAFLLGAIVSIFLYKKKRKKWWLFISLVCSSIFIYSIISLILSIYKYGF